MLKNGGILKKRRKMMLGLFMLLLIICICAIGPIAGAYTYPFQDPALTVDERVNDLVSRLTLAEKIAQLGNNAPGVSRLGIPAYNYWSEALHGVARSGLATSFPQPIALASTWDPTLVNNVASAISDEARVYSNTTGKGLTYWCPTMNMAKDPRWGRVEETYGEDNYLASQIAVNFIKGMQGSDPKYLKTVATAKHFAGYSVEANPRTNSNIDEISLREYYLPVFKAAVIDGNAQSLMSVYPSINKIPGPCNTKLLTDILRTEWGFKGYIVSDCDAVADIVDSHHYASSYPAAAALAIKAGTDLNCGSTYQNNVNTAISNGLMTEADVNTALKRIFRERFLLGEFDPSAMVPYKSIPSSKLDCQANRDLAVQSARESIVLLKNQNAILPLNKSVINKIAIIGPNADKVQLGGYTGSPSINISPFQGVRTKLLNDIFIGAAGFDSQSGVQIESQSNEVRSYEGQVSAVGYINNGDYVVYNNVNFSNNPTTFEANIASATSGGNIEIRLDSPTGTLVGTCPAPGTGGWQNWSTVSCGVSGLSGTHNLYLKFTGGSGFLFNIKWLRFTPLSGKTVSYAQGCTITGAKDQAMFDAAVNLAGNSDVAVVVCGTDMEDAVGCAEGANRSSLDLPGVQEQLIQAIYQANPKTIVVLVHASSLSINWAQANIPGIISAWYGGQAQGTAIADVLFGDYNPGGKLTTTWFASVSGMPDINDYYIKNNRTYLYYTGAPLYPFGYGLSYTTFTYGNLRVSSGTIGAGGTVTVSVDITNSGGLTGDEVAQLYIHDVSSNIKRPIKQLKGFARVNLTPGQMKTVDFVLKYDDLAFYDAYSKKFIVEDGAFDILVGSSSSDIRVSTRINAVAGVSELVKSACIQNEAEYFDGKSGSVRYETCGEGGLEIGWIVNNDYVVYNNIDFGSGVSGFQARIAADGTNGGGTIEIRLDSSNGILLGTLNVAATGGWQTYTNQSCNVNTVTGKHNLYLVFKTGAGKTYVCNLNWFTFISTSAIFRTGFESGDTQPAWSDTVDWSANVSGYFSNINPECSARSGEQAHGGSSAIMFSGTDNSSTASYCYYKVFDVNIPITATTKLSYWFYPQQDNGRYVAIDFICTDGTNLRDSGAVDYNGVKIHPNAGHGSINSWSQIQCDVGKWLNGKTIDRILIAYDRPSSTGQYRGYIDDILMTN